MLGVVPSQGDSSPEPALPPVPAGTDGACGHAAGLVAAAIWAWRCTLMPCLGSGGSLRGDWLIRGAPSSQGWEQQLGRLVGVPGGTDDSKR